MGTTQSPRGLPRLPGSEPLDKRVAAVFLVLTLALLGPSLPGVFQPIDRTDLASTRDELASDVRQLLATIDSRPKITEPYFRTSVGDIVERVRGVHEELVHRAVDADVRPTRDELAEDADALAAAAGGITPAFDDPDAVANARATIEMVGRQLDALGTLQ